MPGTRIMIVEDELIISLEIKETLRRLGYEVVARVISGEDAIEKAGELNPDLILMDIRLEGEMDGITAAKRIIDLYDIPIIFLTGQSDEATLKRAIEISPSGYLVKPFNERELFSNIEMSIHKSKIKKKLYPEKPALEEKMNSFLNESSVPFLFLNPSLIVTSVNRATESHLGIPAVQLVKKPFNTLFHSLSEGGDTIPDPDPEKVILLPDQIGIRDKDGKYLPVIINLGFILNRQGILQNIITSLAKPGRQETRSTPDRYILEAYDKLLANLEVPAYIINREKIIVVYNQAFYTLCQQIGVSKYQLERPLYETKNLILFGEVLQYDEIFKTGFVHREGRKYVKGGKQYFIRINRFPIHEDKTVSYVVTLMFDVTSEITAKDDAKRTLNLFQEMVSTMDQLNNKIGTLKPLVLEIIHRSVPNENTTTSDFVNFTNEVTTLLQNIDMSWIKYTELKDDLLPQDSERKN